ncbi:MAG: hypothetical protein ABSA79_12585 [Candidatus Bathyarchaeia archaeon]|jgi:hypothetical protein
MKRKTLLISIIALTTILISSSMITLSQAGLPCKPKPEYVIYDFKVSINPTGVVNTLMDTSGFPVVIQEIYSTEAAIVSGSVTINGAVYNYPKDFDYSYTGHMELNYVTGYGLDIIQETLTFKNLPGHPTLNGRAEEKVSGLILSPAMDISHWEEFGNFQLTGTKMFSDVQGNGAAMGGVSTGYVVRHFGLISGWPL